MANRFILNPQTGERMMLVDNQWVPAAPAKGVANPTNPSALGVGKLTEAQAKDGFNAKRMVGAGRQIAPLEEDGYDAGLGSITPGFLPGNDRKRKYESSALEWSDSLLRMTTGAAATQQEIENTRKTYFPTLGDSSDVRRQKAEMRRRVEGDARFRAGPGFTEDTKPSGKMRSTRNMAEDINASRKPASSPRGYRILSVS